MEILFFAFCTKHFVVDFPLQQPNQYLNKGKYGHPGGLLHSIFHVCGTFIVLWMFFSITPGIIFLSLLDGIIHYHVDWAKMNINEKYKWKCNETDKFWILMGFDQYLHYLTYIAIIWIVK